MINKQTTDNNVFF